MLDDQQRKMAKVYDHIFYFRNDDAHKRNHAEEVHEIMVDLNYKLKYGIDNRSLFLAAYIHDAFTGIDRSNHAKLGAEYIRDIGDDYVSLLTEVERSSVAFAIEYHRASNDENNFGNHPLTKILRIADKGKPDLHEQIKRSLQYTISSIGTSNLDKVFEDVAFHMTDKYGRNGYAWNKDDPYIEYHNNAINKMWDDIDKLTIEDVKNVYTSSL